MAFTIKAIRGLLELEDRWTTVLEKASNKTAGFNQKVAKQLDDVGMKMTKGGATLTAAITAPILGIAAASLKMANDFEGAMNKVEAVMPDSSTDNLVKLRQAAQDMGAATVFSSKQAAEALAELGKAGFDTNKSIEALPTVLQLAVAGQMELAEAATLSANTMSTFRLKATDMAKANDILAKAANESTIDVRDLAETFKYVGPIAAGAGVSLSEVSAAAAVLGSAGIKASQAGTTLRGALGALMKPTKSQAEAIHQLGLDNAFADGKMISLVEVVDRMAKSGADTSVVMQAFGKYSGPGMAALLAQGSDALGEMNMKLNASEGFAQKVADTYMKGLPGALERAKGSIETAGIALGGLLVPALTAVANATEKVANFITGTVVPAFMNLPQPVQVTIGILVALAAAAGPVIAGIGLMSSGIAALMPLIPILGTALAALTGPVGLVLAAITGLAAAWYKWGDDVTAAVSNTYNSAKEWLVDKWEGSIFQSIARMLESMVKLWVALQVKVLEVVIKIAGDVAAYLVDKLKPVYEFVKPFIDTIALAWKVASGAITSIVSNIYTAVKSYLVDKFAAIVNAVKEKIDAVTGFFNNMYEKVVGHSYVPDMINGIIREFAKLGDGMVKPSQIAVNATSSLFATLGQKIGSTLGVSKEAAGQIGGFMSGLVGSLGGGLEGLKGFLGAEGTSIAKDFTSKLLSFVPIIGPSLAKLGGPIVDGVKKIFGGIFGGADGRGMVEDFVKKSYGSFDNLHNQLLKIGDAGEQLWIKLTQKVGRGDKVAAKAAIEEVEAALRASMEQTETAVSDAHGDIATDAAGLHDDIQEIFSEPFKIPYFFEAQNQPGVPASAATSTTVTPSGSSGIVERNRPVNIQMNIDGRTAARATLPYLADEVELNTA